MPSQTNVMILIAAVMLHLRIYIIMNMFVSHVGCFPSKIYDNIYAMALSFKNSDLQ